MHLHCDHCVFYHSCNELHSAFFFFLILNQLILILLNGNLFSLTLITHRKIHMPTRLRTGRQEVCYPCVIRHKHTQLLHIEKHDCVVNRSHCVSVWMKAQSFWCVLARGHVISLTNKTLGDKNDTAPLTADDWGIYHLSSDLWLLRFPGPITVIWRTPRAAAWRAIFPYFVQMRSGVVCWMKWWMG